MTELQGAIAAVNSGILSFCKFVSSNDAGTTGGHQAGLYIPRNSIPLLFNKPGVKGQQLEKWVDITWWNGDTKACRFIYYGRKTRNEYRITNLGRTFNEDDLVIIVKLEETKYAGFCLTNPDDKQYFLQTFGLSRKDTNNLLPSNQTDSPFSKTENLLTPLGNESYLVPDTVEDTDIDALIPTGYQEKIISFRPKAHILILLGEELIKNPVMAIYELIKNGYDADAKSVEVNFKNIENLEEATIIVKDTGTGITEEVLENVWFEPGSDFRKPISEEGIRVIKRSPLFKRIPMGEKGVGRFAVHKLGNKIRMYSRPAIIHTDNNENIISKELLDYELIVDIDWRRFSQSRYLEDVNITWYKNRNKENFRFKNDSGTYIEISDLKEEWTRGMARQLKRNTISMLSPKNDPSKFKIDLNFNNNWLDHFPETEQILQSAPYKLAVLIDENYKMTFEYSFLLKNNPQIGNRDINEQTTDSIDKAKYERNIKQELKPFFESSFRDKGYEPNLLKEMIEKYLSHPMPYGNLMLEIYSFDLDAESLRDTTDSARLVRELLKDHAGIKVFKGDLRVYDYGDPGNDWLGLDLKRIQNKEWFSNNQNIGYIYMDPATSGALIEKTNREGFIENDAYNHFRVILDFILTQFSAERQSDRQKWLRFNKSGPQESFESRISALKSLILKLELQQIQKQELITETEKVEERYEQDRNNLLIPAGVGMTASFAMHEIEKLVPRMQESIREMPVDIKKMRGQMDELNDYVQGILSVLKKGGNKEISLREVINQAIKNYTTRLSDHKIAVEANISDNADKIIADKRVLITIIMNLLDNSLYWLGTVYRQQSGIYISTAREGNITSVLVVDNGPGFKDKTEDVVLPFFSRKKDGIGIGLYLIDTIMIQFGKLNIIHDKEILRTRGVPEMYDGAAVELIFNKKV
ncbi:EcoRII N-terminal effector-binding domain-containing protein [Chitinophaga polysaccharea]|uniref:EcoRII N-terminal effector-binding domain-containing protein n=1 Tax=Chitinophaga polysaccharea TaxID=1293035 RepID=UPI00115A9FC5|nr:EcoRII N-terminal effector-binding domain-containing protein [Chitinophaga polysaccharea]